MADGQPVMPLTDAAYGEQKTFREQQQSAPMAAAGGAPAMPGFDPAAAGVVPLGEPSQAPDEPITAGAPFGPGPGPEVLGPPLAQQEASRLKEYLPVIEAAAQRPEASQTLRNLVMYLRGVQ